MTSISPTTLLVALALAGGLTPACGGSASETPPPLEPVPKAQPVAHDVRPASRPAAKANSEPASSGTDPDPAAGDATEPDVGPAPQPTPARSGASPPTWGK